MIKSQPRLAARSATQAVNEVFAALPETAPVISKPATVAPITPTMFNERFAASEAQGVPSNAASASPPGETPKLASKETSKTSSLAAKVAEAPKKETSPAPVKVAALPVPPPPGEAKTANSGGSSIRDMAQRAKAAVMSIASTEKRTVFEKLWGKQASQGSLLAYASADASITGSLGQGLGQNQNPALGGSAPYDRSTAVYDISAHVVYLPDGTKLEAHSGLGDKLDDPSSAKIRMRGVTPPHIYELKPREALFHGVPALRLTPIGGEEAIYGRSGLLAHTFMLGPNGDSNGCVSIKDYDRFLKAYNNGEVTRLVVVPNLREGLTASRRSTSPS
jgi:hypothetical protein